MTVALGASLAQSAAPTDVAAPPSTAKQIAPGIFTVVRRQPEATDHPTANDCAVIRFTAWKRDGSLFSTSGVRNQTITQCLSTAMPGMAATLQAMSPGEKRRAWFSAAPVKAPQRGDPDEVTPPVPLTVDLELVAIRKAPAVPPDLKAPPADAIRFTNGVAMRVLRPGAQAERSSPGTQLTIHFSAWNESGRLVETTVMSGHPATMALGSAPEGWRDALKLMTPGERVRLWVPAALVSADAPAQSRVNLVYDLELIRSN